MPDTIRGRFPNEPTFTHLLAIASKVRHTIIHDAENGVDATFQHLLADVLQTQQTLRKSLPETVFDSTTNLVRESRPCILILSPGNYEFVVAGLAILSIGAAFAALATGLLQEETLHILKTSQVSCILADEPHLLLAQRCERYAADNGLDLTVLPISNSAMRHHKGRDIQFEIDKTLVVTPERPALLLYTSGTSGRPKGVVHDRRLFYDMHGHTRPSDVFMSQTTVIWASGLVPLFASVLGGARTEITPQRPDVMWERLKQGGITTLGCSPRVWSDMRQFYDNYISHRPPEEHDAYVSGLRSLKSALTCGSMPDPTLLLFWHSLGKRLRVCYGITELGAVVMRTTDDTDINLECAIGRPVLGVTVKLSDGDFGELLVKKAVMFTRYIGGEDDTSASFTDDGFYKTGDLVHRNGDDYVLEGRASTDFIRFRGLKVPMLQVEMHLLRLPYVYEGCILPVFDTRNGQRVAALVRLHSLSGEDKADSSGTHILEIPYLKNLRDHLGETLPTYMLPTALRILQTGEDIPRTPSLKVIRAEAVSQYFPPSKSFEYPSDVELFNFAYPRDELLRKAWDSAGMV